MFVIVSVNRAAAVVLFGVIGVACSNNDIHCAPDLWCGTGTTCHIDSNAGGGMLQPPSVWWTAECMAMFVARTRASARWQASIAVWVNSMGSVCRSRAPLRGTCIRSYCSGDGDCFPGENCVTDTTLPWLKSCH